MYLLKNSITQIAHYNNTFHFLRYVHFRYATCLFTNIPKQQNTLKSSLLFKKNTNLNNSRILRIQETKVLGYYFYMNTNKWRESQIFTGVPLRKLEKTNKY